MVLNKGVILRFYSWIKKEILHVVPVFLFFFFFFILINWIESLLFRELGLSAFTLAQIAIAAALIAKIVLVADHLSFIGIFRNKPLIWGITWKTIIYWIALSIVRLLIIFTPYLFQEGLQAFRTDQINWNLFIAVQIYYLMLLFIFVTFQQLAEKIGSRKMRQMFLGY